jgi:hypothetical protein
MGNLLTEGKANAKLAKSGATGEWYTVSLFMAPHTMNEKGVNLCPFASKECIATCLNTAGRAAMFPDIIKARIRKANEFLSDRTTFVERLKKEIRNAEKRAQKHGLKLCVRLNGTTDIDWPESIFLAFPNVVFYDYTKSHYRMAKYLRGALPSNYHLTFSFSGENETQALGVLNAGGNVAVVFDSPNFPKEWQGYQVINGDNSDLRFLDPKAGAYEGGYVVALKAKGKAKKLNAGGFVQLTQIERRAA